jgi:hypothetical protein
MMTHRPWLNTHPMTPINMMIVICTSVPHHWCGQKNPSVAIPTSSKRAVTWTRLVTIVNTLICDVMRCDLVEGVSPPASQIVRMSNTNLVVDLNYTESKKSPIMLNRIKGGMFFKLRRFFGSHSHSGRKDFFISTSFAFAFCFYYPSNHERHYRIQDPQASRILL